ncbi:MAG TPA: dihydrodipicolinate synthase family protein, partial [Methylomirabilota bacterium]|nr:dihydrodipicolinate synthase family protein [Methylomirabilota bacterium]
VLMGADGGVNGGANVHPRLYVDLYEAAAARDVTRLLELQARVLELSRGLYTVGRHASAIIKGLKCALSLLGICEGALAEPFHCFKAPERHIIAERLRELGLLR